MSRSVDPADRNRAVTPIPSNDCSDKSSGRSVPPIGSFLGRQQDFPGGFDDRGSREVMRKCAMISPNAILDWPLLARKRPPADALVSG